MTVFRGANPFDQLTRGVKSLLVANVGIFFLQMMVRAPLVEYLGLTPILIIQKGWIWQLITYSFLHGNGWHLFFNMFALWMFGPHIESQWGTKSFLIYYFLCVLGAAFSQFLISPYQLVVGASGAIYGLLLAFGLLFPDAVIYLFFVFPFRAIHAVLFIAILTLVFALSAGGARVAHFAHLGGMLTGFLYFSIPKWRERFRLWRFQKKFYIPLKVRQSEGSSNDDELTTRVDQILEKISASGIESLTKDEHLTMQRYAKRKH